MLTEDEDFGELILRHHAKSHGVSLHRNGDPICVATDNKAGCLCRCVGHVEMHRFRGTGHSGPSGIAALRQTDSKQQLQGTARAVVSVGLDRGGSEMKAIVGTSCLPVVASVLSQLAAADPAESKTGAQQSVVARFVVYSSERDAELRSSLLRVLRGDDKVARIAKADTIEKATESEADVLILVMPDPDLPKLEPKTLDALKKRKLVGIGSGAARLFGKIGLEINLGACAHFGNAPPSIKITRSDLLGDPKSTRPVPVLKEAPADKARHDNFAVFLPPRGPNASFVDVIARWSDQPNYAPIVRQGNCILIGVPVPATRWTGAYANLIRDLCKALHERKTEPFAPARKELTRPGTYEFKLAKRGSPDEPFEKAFFFRFSEATKVTCRLENAGSDAVMLLFMGEDENRTHWTRRDARNGETLEINVSIRQEDIQTLADRYWTLKVTNFGANSPVECRLRITCEMP